jgi:hypothetical protein
MAMASVTAHRFQIWESSALDCGVTSLWNFSTASAPGRVFNATTTSSNAASTVNDTAVAAAALDVTASNSH